MESHVFSDEDFARFSFAVAHWMTALGLTEWKYDVMHHQIGDRVCAQVQYNCVTRSAVFRLTKAGEFDYGHETNVIELAKHEVLHLLLADYCFTASKARDEYADLVIAHEHAVINRLSRCIPYKETT